MSTKPILAFDTATNGASIALLVNGNVTTRAIGQTSQAAQLIPMIDELLNEANVDYNDLAAIVTTIGPGSFTGVRIGLAALHGFVLVNHTPVKTITTLEAMTWQVTSAHEFYIALRAGKGEVYAQKFHGTKPINDVTLYPEAKTDWDAPCFGNHIATDDAHYIAGPDAALLCTVADQLPTTSLADAMPLYIRPPDAIVGAPHAWLSAH
jgi:tRNA threonylcarbamoyl adenosine modification protein YeaZ